MGFWGIKKVCGNACILSVVGCIIELQRRERKKGVTMANVSARQNTPVETSAFREYLRPFMGNGITFRMTSYKIGAAFADSDNESVGMSGDFIRAANEMLTFINGTDTEFHDYACGYRDRCIELCADVPEYQAQVKAAYGMGA
jgi:hypothetical protein